MMQSIIARLNAEEAKDVIEGLQELASTSSADEYLHSSPLAFEVTRVWTDSNNEKIEIGALQALEHLVSNGTDEQIRIKLGWSLLKSERIVERLRQSLVKHETANQVLTLRLFSELSSVDSALSREIQAKFDFRSVTLSKEDRKHVQRAVSKHSKSSPLDLEKQKVETLFRLTNITLERGDDHAKRMVLEGPLTQFCFEHLLDISSVLIKDFVTAVIANIHHRSLLGNKPLANFARCAKLHPEDEGKDLAVDFLRTLVNTKRDRVASKLIEFLDPIQDERHAGLLEVSLAHAKKDLLVEVFDTKKGLSVLEPRASFPWIRTVSLVCRLLLSCPPKRLCKTYEQASQQILPPEPVLSRASLTRGLLFQNNLVKLYSMDLLAHVLHRAQQLLQQLDSPQDRRKFSEHLTRRLPESTVLLQAKAALTGSPESSNNGGEHQGTKDQEKVLFLRSLHLLEQYGNARIACGFDPLKLIPFPSSVEMESSCSLTWYRLSKMLQAHQRNINPDEWLRISSIKLDQESADEEMTVLASLLYILASKSNSMTTETRSQFVSLACQALHSSGLVDPPMDASSVSCVLGTDGAETIVSIECKKWIYFAIQSVEHVRLINALFVKVKKNRRVTPNLSVAAASAGDTALLEGRERIFDVPWMERSNDHFSKDALLAHLELVPSCDLPEVVSSKLARMLDEQPGNDQLVFLFRNLVQMCCLAPTKPSHLIAIHSLLRSRPQLSEACLLELNAVVQFIISNKHSSSSSQLFGIIKEISEFVRDYAKRLWASSLPSTSAKDMMLVARSALLFSPEERIEIASKFASSSREFLLPLATLVTLDIELLLRDDVFEVIFSYPENQQCLQVLDEGCEKHPIQVAHLVSKHLTHADRWTKAVVQSDCPKSLRRVFFQLSTMPGPFAFAMASTKSRDLQVDMALSAQSYTSSVVLNEVLDGALRSSLIPADDEELPVALVAAMLDRGGGALDPNLLLRCYLKLPEPAALRAKEQLFEISGKAAVDKQTCKDFWRNVLDKPSVKGGMEIAAHLLTLKRLKPVRVFRDLQASNTFEISSVSQTQLLLRCLEIDFDGCYAQLTEGESEEDFYYRILLAYQGTLGHLDKCLRRVIHLFCTTHPDRYSLARFGFAFGPQLPPVRDVFRLPTSTLSLQSPHDYVSLLKQHFAWVTDALDPNKLRRRPDLNRGMVPDEAAQLDDNEQEHSYDPSFVLPVLNHVLGLFAILMDLPYGRATVKEDAAVPEETDGDHDIPEATTAVAWMTHIFPAKRWLNSGHVDFIIHCMSSNNLEVRIQAYDCIQRFAQITSRLPAHQHAFRERDEILLVLRAFKAGITEPYQRVPSLIGSIVLEYLHIVAKGAAHPQYSKVHAFLFSDSGFDLTDIPHFYALFNSGAMDYEQDRVFIIRTLSRGIHDKDDLKLLSRRHVIEAVMSTFASSLSDATIRKAVLYLLRQVLRVPKAGALALLKHGFLPFCLDVLSQLAVADEDANKPIWRIGDDRATEEDFIKEIHEMAVEFSEMLMLISKARLGLAQRVQERDKKRPRMDVAWFPRCEWSCDEAEFLLAAPRIIDLMCRFNSVPIFTLLLDVLYHQRGTLRLSVVDIIRLLKFVQVDPLRRRNLTSRVVEVIVAVIPPINEWYTEVQTDEALEVIQFVLSNVEMVDDTLSVLTWLAQMCRMILASRLPVEVLLRPYATKAVASQPRCVLMLNEICCTAALARAGKDSELLTQTIPALLERSERGEKEAIDLLAVCLRSVLLTRDENQTTKIVDAVSAVYKGEQK